jgi:hypothetical protein
MAISPTEVIEQLAQEYKRLLPLLNYLRVRLKYDTVRWIKTCGTKDDIVFSTRTKTFDRTLDKLIRKAVSLTKHSDLLKIILSNKGILDDLIGIRFICFDAFQIYRLVSYFLITERVTTSERTFYISSKADLAHPVYSFLQSNGFKALQKEGREYEDIDFIIRFSHPIDKYFGSGREQFESLAQRADPPHSDEKLAAVNTLFDALKAEPDLISAISRFPIECQIVTATQHIYNRTQRPHYEYILQGKGDEPTISAREVADLADRLNVLKLSLLAADLNVFSIHKKFGIRYEAPSRINPGGLFRLAGRLPKDIFGENARIEEINANLLPTLIANETTTLKRREVLQRFFSVVEAINKKIAERAKTNGDIIVGNVLHINDFEDITHPAITFWSFQRIIVLIICVMLLYVHDETILREIVKQLRFGRQVHTLTDINIVIGRLFEKLEHLDNAVHTKLWYGAEKIAGWKDGYFSKNVFSDPLIQWRYASFMYGRREYDNALQEINVGKAVYAQLEQWSRVDVPIGFPVPEQILFTRRSVEYELCAEVAGLKFSPLAVAGVMELCNCILSRVDEWNSKLEEVIAKSGDLIERTRCTCLQILLKLCALSAGGLEGPAGVSALHEEFKKKFDDVESSLEHKGESDVKNRTWWLLAKSVMQEEKPQPLVERFNKRIETILHHPPERKLFEKACATLISLWRPEQSERTDRNNFSINALELIREQTQRIVQSEAISRAAVEQSLVLTNILAETLRELKEKGEIKADENMKKKITELAGDSVEHIVIDTVVAGIRSILGI